MSENNGLTMSQLGRKLDLLDEYATTLERQNLAKNRETTTIYAQLEQLRVENDVLKNHISMILRNNSDLQQQKPKPYSSSHFVSEAQKNANITYVESFELKQKNGQSELISEMDKICSEIGCQTEQTAEQKKIEDSSVVHFLCSQQIEKLSRIISENQNKLSSVTQECDQMYESIESLEKQLQASYAALSEKDEKLNTQHKKLKFFSEENEQLRAALEQSLAEAESSGYSSAEYEQQLERLIKQNNQMIEKIRILEKQKNSYYRQLRSVSPLRSSKINYQNKPQSQSIKFTQGKQKENLKNQRWKMIEGKINQLKNENQQIQNNLSYY